MHIAKIYEGLESAIHNKKRMLAVLVDPEKFIEAEASQFFKSLPGDVNFIFVGGSTVPGNQTETTVQTIKKFTTLPVILFPGDYSQITEAADGLLFLSLISGRNPEYLIEQQVKSARQLKYSSLELIPTGYILIDGGTECAVQRVSNTKPLPQDDLELVVNTALAGQFSGKKLIYLEAGSGAKFPVSSTLIAAVKEAISVPLVVGGGIRTRQQMEAAYKAGADMIVVGTALEEGAWF